MPSPNTAACFATPAHTRRLLAEAWNVYEWMVEDGLWPDRSTYSRLISVRPAGGSLWPASSTPSGTSASRLACP